MNNLYASLNIREFCSEDNNNLDAIMWSLMEWEKVNIKLFLKCNWI